MVIGHPFEYSREHLQWQLKNAGFSNIETKLRQYENSGFSFWATLGRVLAYPFLIRPLWRDSIMATAINPRDIKEGAVPQSPK